MKYPVYDPETGKFYGAKGTEVGSVNKKSGYVYVHAERKHMLAHRVAWRVFYGVWPKDQLDHINGDRGDNRIANLREATRSQNMANSAGRRSGLKGIIIQRKPGLKKKFGAALRKDGKNYFFGNYETEEEAHAAYVKAARELFGEFANGKSRGASP